MKIFIKNMVCIRCEMIVKSELDKLGLSYRYVRIGEADLISKLSQAKAEMLNTALKKSGLELLDDKKSLLVEKIRSAIIDWVRNTEDRNKEKLSEHLSAKLDYDYMYLSNLFSEVMGTTIEQFFIAHRIERAKELLIYDEMNLTEIADLLHFSSVAHLSNQFRKVTGFTPSAFRQMKNRRRSTLENVGIVLLLLVF
jgi:AraC-like DNA-binding protein